MNKKTVIFDLDGTLADIDVRRNKSLKPNGKLNWDIFAAPDSIMNWDKPNLPVIKMAQMFKADGFKIVIFSLPLRNGLLITMYHLTSSFLGPISSKLTHGQLLMGTQQHLI